MESNNMMNLIIGSSLGLVQYKIFLVISGYFKCHISIKDDK